MVALSLTTTTPPPIPLLFLPPGHRVKRRNFFVLCDLLAYAAEKNANIVLDAQA